MLLDFGAGAIALIGLLFIWTGFVRTALGFGGAALGLPLLLFIHDQPVDWLPIIGAHLLFFSALTLRTRLSNVDWGYLKKSSVFIVPAALAGVFGLLKLPNQWLLIFIYGITLYYAVTWAMGWIILSHSDRVDKFMLVAGGYVAGVSLTGAPLMVAVYMRHVAAARLRDTLFVLWFVLVAIKMSTFAALGVSLHLDSALMLLPLAAIGHYLGIKVHEKMVENDQLFKRIMGGMLVMISSIGLAKTLLS